MLGEKDHSGRHHGHGCPPDGFEGPFEGPGPEKDSGRPRHPHGHRPPVLSRERILTVLLDHETALEKEEQTAETAGLRQKQFTERVRINESVSRPLFFYVSIRESEAVLPSYLTESVNRQVFF